jgi:arginine/lysine/ornithine decarboxylase
MMSQNTKKSTQKDTASSGVVSPVHTHEIRKFIKARDIVEAMNMDVCTAPSYIVMVDQAEEEQELKIGY